MQVATILICVVVLSTAQAALVTRIPKPKLNTAFSEKLKIPEIPKHKSPEDRRKFSLFPKSYRKYVISPEPIYEIETHKPIVHGTKKPLMKKLNLHDKKNKDVENEAEQPVDEELMNEKHLTVHPKTDDVEASEETSKQVVENKSEESNEKQNDDTEEISINKPKKDDSEKEDKHKNVNREEEDKLKNNDSEERTEKIEIATPYSDTQEKLILEITTFPTTVNHNEVSVENKNLDSFVNVVDKKEHSKETETSDWTEFILVDPTQKSTESDKISSEDLEEFVTTELYEESEIDRVKRGSNVIEEENLASTVAGYKYTWKDTRLNHDVSFKNIHT